MRRNVTDASRVADDMRSIEAARKRAAKRKDASAADRQIAEQLEKLSGVQAPEDPERSHGS